MDFKLNTNGTFVEGVEAAATNIDNINYATNFLAYIGFASQIPNVIFNWLNIFVNMGYVFVFTLCRCLHICVNCNNLVSCSVYYKTITDKRLMLFRGIFLSL